MQPPDMFLGSKYTKDAFAVWKVGASLGLPLLSTLYKRQ